MNEKKLKVESKTFDKYIRSKNKTAIEYALKDYYLNQRVRSEANKQCESE